MRTLPLVLVAAAALLSPATALAGGAPAPTARYFVITGLVLGDQKADASGKMGIEGDRFFASVGCNTIGGTVSVDGDTVTIGDSAGDDRDGLRGRDRRDRGLLREGPPARPLPHHRHGLGRRRGIDDDHGAANRSRAERLGRAG